MNFNEWKIELEVRLRKYVAGESAATVPPVPPVPSVKSPVKLRTVKQVRQRTTGLKVYLAGKISKDDWRHTVVPKLRNDERAWRQKDTLPTFDGNVYVGPFFISCDHGCYHKESSHGALSGGDCNSLEQENTKNGEDPLTKTEVFNKAVTGIKACDLFFVWAGSDFGTAYGTMTEIGIAHALGKRVVIGHDGSLKKDYWFVLSCASEAIKATDAVGAYSIMIGVESNKVPF